MTYRIEHYVQLEILLDQLKDDVSRLNVSRKNYIVDGFRKSTNSERLFVSNKKEFYHWKSKWVMPHREVLMGFMEYMCNSGDNITRNLFLKYYKLMLQVFFDANIICNYIPLSNIRYNDYQMSLINNN